MAKEQTPTNELQMLKAAIKARTPERLYFFYGEETFLLQHYLQQLRKILVDELTESFNFHKLTAETFDMRSFAEAVENLPMMAETTFVWVDEIDIFKLNESDREKMCEILSDIPEYCTVVFTYGTTEWNPDKRLKKLWDAVVKNGRMVAFEKQERRDLISWITRHFAANGKKIPQELCGYLIDLTGGTMTALAGEIAKISAYSGADTVTKSDIDAVTEPVLDAVMFQITNCLSDGDYGTALVKLRNVLKMQEEPVLVLGAIGAHLRRLGTARTLLDNGKNSDDLMRLYKISEYAARKTMKSASGVSARFCAKAAELVLETDRKMKTSYDTPERLLELLILQLAQEARNGKN